MCLKIQLLKSMMSLVRRSKSGSKPVRTCCVCRIQAVKKTLNRFVLENNGPVQDIRQNKTGRGAYCCQNERCLAVFLSQQKRWEKALKVKNAILASKS